MQPTFSPSLVSLHHVVLGRCAFVQIITHCIVCILYNTNILLYIKGTLFKTLGSFERNYFFFQQRCIQLIKTVNTCITFDIDLYF